MSGGRTSMWGGRFDQAIDLTFRQFNDSLGIDAELLPEEIAASKAWADALRAAGVLSDVETVDIVRALNEILEEVKASGAPLEGAEDVHSFVESKLVDKLGEPAGKIHTGRSRNDQVATDLRLYLRNAFDEALHGTGALVHALASRAIAEAGTPMPGYTHLKQAEPITFGLWCLAYAHMVDRDSDRFLSARIRANECPLGSAALAGTPIPIDRDALAAALGFDRPTACSLDGVSDRDAAADYLYASTMLLTHLSRFAEDLIFFSSDEVGFVVLPDSLATGSSRMPQKKNPDLLELIRGHAARSIGDLTGLLALLKGLPLAYDKDLQLDKEPVFRMRKTLSLALPLVARLISELSLDRDRMLAAASSDLLLATQVADAMAARGVPFRTAHVIVSRRIGEAVASGVSLKDLGPSDEITAGDLTALDVHAAIAKKDVVGGTAPGRVTKSAQSLLSKAHGGKP